MERGAYVGHHERSGAALFLTPSGMKRGTRISRMTEADRWDHAFLSTCRGLPWQPRPTQRETLQPVVPSADAENGVAPIVGTLSVPKPSQAPRRRYVTKADLEKHGFTDECPACTQLAVGARVASVAHSEACRDRIGKLMEESDDLRQTGRLKRHRERDAKDEPEDQAAEPPQAGQEMEVGEPSVREPPPEGHKRTSPERVAPPEEGAKTKDRTDRSTAGPSSGHFDSTSTGTGAAGSTARKRQAEQNLDEDERESRPTRDSRAEHRCGRSG